MDLASILVMELAQVIPPSAVAILQVTVVDTQVIWLEELVTTIPDKAHQAHIRKAMSQAV